MAVDAGDGVTLFRGEVTGIGVELDATAARLVLHCYDRAHRLQRRTRTKTYRDSTVSAVVHEVASGAALDVGHVTSTSATHAQLIQANVDDWTFLQHLAGRLGWVCAMERGRLGFHPVGEPVGEQVPIDRWQDDVSWLRAQVSAAQQVGSVEVRAWDAANQDAMVSGESVATASASTSVDPAGLAGRFGGGLVVASAVCDSLDEVSEMAKGLATRVGGTYAEIEADLAGDPRLAPGAGVELSGFGDPVDGTFVVTATQHVWDEGHGYRTRFTVSDRQDRSLLGLAAAGGGEPVNRVHALVPALVSDIDDEEGLDRVKLTLPWLDAQLVTGWARTVQVGAGSGHGNRFVPEVGDEVLVGFEQGDLGRPYVLGGLYSAQRKPYAKSGKVVEGGQVRQRVLSSRTGQRIILSDVNDDLCVKIVSGDDATTMVIGGRDAGLTVTTERDVSIKSDADITLEATGTLTLKGRTVNVAAGDQASVKANNQVSVEGVQVAVKGNGQVTVEASGVTSIKGALVEIN